MIRPAVARDWQSVETLLKRAGLPTADLHAGRMPDFLVAQDRDGGLVGAIALEQLGRDGLLRSLVVAEQARDNGLGASLVDAVESLARRRNLSAVWLLTIDAAAYFERRGYERKDREDAPPAVRGCPEFADLCPGTAVLMVRSILL